MKIAKKCLTYILSRDIISKLPKTAGAAKLKSCRGALNMIFCVSFCLLAGRFFIFGGENNAQRKGS